MRREGFESKGGLQLKKCFVIMPYGGSDEASRRHCDGIYHAIIAPAAVAAGFEPKRSDIAGEPGNITHDIIRDLAESDVVIADLTTGNANVFFELGIRHAFRKSGTVHIVDGAQRLPFDVRQYRAIEFSTDLASVPDAVRSIAEAISKRQQSPARSDNPVHDAIPELPVNLMSVGDSALRDRLVSAEASLEEIGRQNDALTAKIKSLEPSWESDGQKGVDVDALLDAADQVMKTTGRHALLRLREAMEEGGNEAFVRELRDVLKSPYLDENDFAEIVVTCRRAGLDGHRRATAELASVRYPHSEPIFLALLSALDDSPNPADGERGRRLLEGRLGIVRDGGLPVFHGPTSLPLEDALAVLFNLYFAAGRQDWVISICGSLPLSARDTVLVQRNVARALAKLDRPEEAEAAFQKAMTIDPGDDTTVAWYSNFLDEHGRFAEAYEKCEMAILADPDDPALYLHMAIQILNRGFFRGKSGAIEGTLVRKSRSSVAIPFVLKALERRQTPDFIQDVVRVLVRGDAVAAAQAIAEGRVPEGDFDSGPLDYVVARMGNDGPGISDSDDDDPSRISESC